MSLIEFPYIEKDIDYAVYEDFDYDERDSDSD